MCLLSAFPLYLTPWLFSQHAHTREGQISSSTRSLTRKYGERLLDDTCQVLVFGDSPGWIATGNATWLDSIHCQSHPDDTGNWCTHPAWHCRVSSKHYLRLDRRDRLLWGHPLLPQPGGRA